MRHRTPRARGQPLRAVCPRNVVRLFRPNGRNWTPRINSGRPTVRLPQTEAWAERERVPSGHNCRRQLATGRPEQIQEPGTAVPGTPIFANNAQRGGPPPLESPCRWLSLVLSFASKESTAPSGRQPDHPRRSRRVMLQPRQGVCAYRRTKGLSSGQTIGAVRTAVRSACCLPELRVANRLRRLYPLDDGELFKFNLKSSVCQRQTGLPKGNPPCAFPAVPAGVLGRREGAGIQWMQLPKAVSD